MNSENLATEQMKKIMSLRTVEDFTAFAMEEGIELTDEMLEAIAGGVVDEDAELALKKAVMTYKWMGMSMDWVINTSISYCGSSDSLLRNCTPEEATDYIKKHWGDYQY